MTPRSIIVFAVLVSLPIGADAADRGSFFGRAKTAKPRTTHQVQEAAAKGIHADLGRELPAAAVPLYVDYTKAVVGHLEANLHKPLTLPGLVRAKASALRFCAKEGWLASMTRAVLEESGVSQSHIERVLQAGARNVPKVAQGMYSFGDQLEQQGFDGKRLAKEFGLNRANQGSLERGELTLADVFATQPALIIKNQE